MTGQRSNNADKSGSLTITYRAVGDLIPYARNARTHSDQNVASIAGSIREFGFTNPVLCDEEGGIIAGHGRVMAARKLDMEDVPTITLAGLTRAQKQALILADNKLAMGSGWAEDLLRLELQDLSEQGFALDIIGFDPADLAGLLTGIDTDLGAEPGVGSAEADGAGAEPGTPGSDENYSRKIEAPIYEPRGEKPAAADLCDDAKAANLTHEIRAARLPKDIERFLILAAQRHTVFDFAKVADFYAHSEPEVQRLMERSALVIIDFNQAIENGYVRMTKNLSAMVAGAEPEEDPEADEYA